jgi:hypothetical protein
MSGECLAKLETTPFRRALCRPICTGKGQFMRTPPIKFALAAVALAGLGLTGGATAASASAHPTGATTAATTTFTAVTSVTAHPDSGAQGNNWATDNFTRTATVHRVNQVSVSFCPGSGTGTCWFYTGTLTDSGTFTSVAGQLAPRTGTLDQALTGSFSGGSKDIEFWSSWKTPNPADVMTKVSGPVSGRETSTNWVEQFFGAGAVFNSAANPGGPDLGNWSWKYTLNFGSNTECPNDAYQWIDSAANDGGSLNTAGNILTPDTADCS